MASQGSSSAPPRDVYACEVSEDWDPIALRATLPRGLTPSLKVKKGDNVWAYHTNQSYSYIHLPTGDTHLRARPQSDNSANVLQKTLRCLWRKIISEQALIKEVIPGMNEQSQSVLFNNTTSAYADVVYKCITPQARNMMATSNFAIEQLMSLQPVSKSWPKEAGVYIIIYQGFGGRKSGNFQKRNDAHTRDAGIKNSTHYSLAKKAKKMVIIPLLLQTESAVPPFFLDIAEFSFVCLFRSWYAALFKPRDPELLGTYTTDYDACVVFSRIMRDVSAETGWNLARTYGLNWNTPVLRPPKVDQPWVSWYEEELKMYKYRIWRTIFLQPDKAHIRWHGRKELGIPLEVAQDAGFVNGQLWQPLSKTNPVLHIYRTGLIILCDMEKTNYTGGPEWLHNVLPTGIQFLRYINLEQKQVVEMVPPRVVPWPEDNTMERNKQRLLELFPRASNPDIIIGPRPPQGFFTKNCNIINP
ncbi:hypothetical protein LZL87_004055 [Fusarium oxysporum]|nr:hypothetical protein LZL87_004055 [Fusarium oxysporum]